MITTLSERWAVTGASTGRFDVGGVGWPRRCVERDLIRTRTAEGRSRAKSQGKHVGRPPSLTGPTERGHQTARAGRYAARTGAQLQRESSADFTAHGMKGLASQPNFPSAPRL